MKRSILALTTTTALFAGGAALADMHGDATMTESMTQLEMIVDDRLAALGWDDYDTSELTINDLARIRDIVDSDLSTSEQQRQLRGLLDG